MREKTVYDFDNSDEFENCYDDRDFDSKSTEEIR